MRWRKRMHTLLGLIVGGLWSCIGCVTPFSGHEAAGKDRSPLLVLAASDLQFALSEIADRYRDEGNPRPILSFGSTGSFAQQVESGAPADLFFAADEAYLERLESKGFVRPESRRLYAIGRIVLVSAPGSARVATLSELTRPELRVVAIANPEHAPYGAAARQALEATGIWETVRSKLVFGENIAQAFQFLRTGNADVAIVALSLAIAVPGVQYTVIDEGLHSPLRQAVGVPVTSSQPRAAADFIDYVLGPEGQAIMTRSGFELPGGN